MRHAKAKYQFNRFTTWHKATLISLAKNLLIYQSIKTTKIRAKAARPFVEKLISLAKKNTLAAKRQAYALLGEHGLVKSLFDDIGIRFKDTGGGYTRIILAEKRRGDDAQMAILELTKIKKEPPKAKKAKEAKDMLQKPHDKTEEKTKEMPVKTEVAVKEKPPMQKKPAKKFFGGIKNIFKKERDSL